jgi:excisionase family DNA binding protein
MTDIHLTRQELSARLKVPVTTLNAWASEGKGPKYALFGRHARYRLSDVTRWENAQFGDQADDPMTGQPQEAACD